MPRIAAVLLAVVGIIAVMAAVLLSPFALAGVATLTKLDTRAVAELGGSYGAASALLSAFALCVVAVSAVLQLKQTRIGQLQASRSLQLELLRMAIDKPEYRASLGSDFAELSEIAWQQHAYINLWIMYLQMAYLTGAITDAAVFRTVSGEIFQSEPGRAYWKAADAVFSAEASTRAERHFLKTVRRAYRSTMQRTATSGEVSAAGPATSTVKDAPASKGAASDQAAPIASLDISQQAPAK